MTYREEDWLQLSGIQHFAFCPRQWGLIHVEGLWKENLLTAEGALQHEKAHDEHANEKRGSLLTVRGMRVFSASLGVSGACDVVEFVQEEGGVPLTGREGRWVVCPVEYKHGAPKHGEADRLQVCAQAMCLEEMLGCEIPQGALFYQQTRRRENVPLEETLRAQVRTLLGEMHDLAKKGHTPRVRTGPRCRACSLAEQCLPGLPAQGSVNAYLDRAMKEDTACDI